MNDKQQHKIASSFSDKYETGQFDIELSAAEFKIFEDGIFAEDMDHKWDVFVLDSIIYFARSWTGNCIYKVLAQKQGPMVRLVQFQVTRDEEQYRSNGIDEDTILLKKLLQVFLKREDLYIDPKLTLPLIKSILETADPYNECIRSIGGNDVGITRLIYNRLDTDEQKVYFDITGWSALKAMIADKDDREPMISLYLHNRLTNASTTYYFNGEGTQLLGQVTSEKIG